MIPQVRKDRRSKLWESDGEAGSSEDGPPNSPQMTDDKQFYGEVARDEEEEVDGDEEDNDEPPAKRHKQGSSDSAGSNQFNLFAIQEHEMILMFINLCIELKITCNVS